MRVAVLGASSEPSRYAFKAVQSLLAKGHEVIGVSPRLPDLGIAVVASVERLPAGVHTLTLYVGPERSTAMAQQLLAYPFSRVIMNPGSENAGLAAAFAARGTEVVEGCTLVMLATGQF
jgi:predicted CoA-binding protein